MIVVTGGAGFIGSNIVRALNKAGVDDIVIVDTFRQGEKLRNLNCLRFADILSRDELFDTLPKLSGVEAIIHQGACSSTTESDGLFLLKNNYEYSKRLLHFCEERGLRLIYASSAATYGDGVRGFREQADCEYPLNAYGFFKLAFDNYVRRRMQRTRAAVVGLRYFNVYGPQERHKTRMGSVVMHLYDQLRSGESMKLFEGSNEYRRDFVHVDDVVAVNMWFLSNSVQGIFNCGSGRSRSFTDLAFQVQQATGGGELEFIPVPPELRGKYQQYTEADLTRLRDAGYRASFLPLEDGVARYIKVLRDSNGYIRD